MGRDKATLTIGPDGPTFIEAIMATLDAAGVGQVRVVVAPGKIGRHRGEIVNPDPERGMLSSIQCGLTSLEPAIAAALIWPVDHPFVAAASVRGIIDAFRAKRAPIVVPTYDGRRGHPVLFSRSTFDELLTADPAEGARAVVHAHGDRIELPVDDAGVLADIDTPEDLRGHSPFSYKNREGSN